MKLALPIIVIAISFGMYFLYISPTVADIKALGLKKVEYNTALVSAGELKAKRDQILIDYNNISAENIDKLNKIIPQNFNAVLFANDLNNIAISDGLQIKDFKTDEPVTDIRDTITATPVVKLYKTTVVTFGVTGSYSQFLRFLGSLETSLRLIDVTGLTITNVGGQKAADSPLQFLLQMNTYSLQ